MSKKILLADDSLTIQKVVELTLAGADYELNCVSNGQNALESLDRSRPDLILADAVMPGKNGYEVCEAVKSNPATARIPVVLLSGTFEPFDRGRADRIGADRVISKPFDAQRLLDEIETLLARAASAPSPVSSSAEGPVEAPAFVGGSVPSTRANESIESEFPVEYQGQERGSAIAEADLIGAEEFSGGPVFLPEPDTGAAAEESETRHPVEETPPGASRAEPSAEQLGLERVSMESAENPLETPAPPPPEPASPAPAVTELTEEQIERIAALVVAKLSDRVLREIAREVVPGVAETVVKRRIEELERGAE